MDKGMVVEATAIAVVAVVVWVSVVVETSASVPTLEQPAAMTASKPAARGLAN